MTAFIGNRYSGRQSLLFGELNSAGWCNAPYGSP